jgi:hypothetical protein
LFGEPPLIELGRGGELARSDRRLQPRGVAHHVDQGGVVQSAHHSQIRQLYIEHAFDYGSLV